MDFHGCVRPAILGKLFSHDHREPVDMFLAYDEVVSSYPPNRAHLEINLDASDSALQEKFLDVIKKYRKLREYNSSTKRGSDKSIQRLRQYKVLPYLDLTHWAYLWGIQIHSEVIAKVLFPDSLQGGRFVRETLAPWAEEAIQASFIGTLFTPD
ncbi:DUF6387 family protein [Microbulbifer yueqingensis]|uniref:Uncharacterized protein n=1 Tax=Microbulbifer yueqingensis TaxID=658219 RepID=A0A1G9CJ80_9GAMM|nr:DUF6387 family protein [Microbulbifer yueqingensis]SDK51678.1 hypothetical protein SAMN05216212_2530 [Microbulbifer yueqingensis]